MLILAAGGFAAAVAPWVLAALLDFIMSLAAFAVWTHFDLGGWWEQRHIAKGQRLDAKRHPADERWLAHGDELPPLRPGEQRWRSERGYVEVRPDGSVRTNTALVQAQNSERVFDATFGSGWPGCL